MQQWPHLMYGVCTSIYKPTSYNASLARWNEYKYFIFQDRAKINSSLRNFFVKYTLIQYHFRMAKIYLCPFSTPINEEILKKID